MASAPDEHCFCLYCGYQLSNLPEPRCPECGLGFDPNDQRTFGPRTWCLRRAWARPPSSWHMLGCLLAFFLFMFIRSTPGNPFYVLWFKDWVVLLIDGLLVLAGLWLFTDYVGRAMMMRGLGPRWSSDASHSRRRARCLSWCVTPLCCGLVLSSWVTNWPLAARFAISKPYLERVAFDLLKQPPPLYGRVAEERLWVGLYYCDLVYVDEVSATHAPYVTFRTGGTVIDFFGEYVCWPTGLVFYPKEPWEGGTQVARGWYIEIEFDF